MGFRCACLYVRAFPRYAGRMNASRSKPHAILIDVIPPDMREEQATRRLSELDALTKTYGGMVIVKLMQKRSIPDYKTYIGSGKLQEIIDLGKAEGANLLIVNNQLKPKQMFAIEEQLRPVHMNVWDRIDLILNIFSKHAQTADAKLQIKLAAVRHMGPRIFGMGMELMQQAGGIGTRGQGETNTEMMKRHLAEQEKHIVKQLERIAVSRAGHRSRRDRIGLRTVSIVGYTNAGKSSLLNALTRKNAYVADALFATLDTRIGKVWLPETQESVLLSDTIGFIQDLPPELVRAFASTLDETRDADLLLHVVDAADAFLPEKIREVEAILKSIGVDRTPTLYVFNKIDTVSPTQRRALLSTFADLDPVFVSAVTGTGLEQLKELLTRKLSSHPPSA